MTHLDVFRNLSLRVKLGAVGVSAITAGLLCLFNTRKKNRKSGESRKKTLIVISGCDSGLGFSMAYWAAKLEYTVLAGCLNPKGEGGNFLREEFSNVHIAPLDVLKEGSIGEFEEECQRLLGATPSLEFGSLVSNAAVAVMAEHFWQTSEMAQSQMNVNFWGSVNLIEKFRHLLIEARGKVVVISSDCSEISLPGLAVYSASKGALENWARALRLEVGKYGVSVVSFQPGSFMSSSRLLSHQQTHYDQMKERLSVRDKNFYGDYFEAYNERLIDAFANPPPIRPIQDSGIRKSFEGILERDMRTTPVYRYASTGEKIFKFLLTTLPTSLSDAMLLKVMQNPRFEVKSTSSKSSKLCQ